MDGTYAPQSPDLSSFLSSPSKSQQPYQPTKSASYAPRSPVIPSFNNQPQHHNLHYQQYQHAPQQSHGSGFGTGAETEYGRGGYMAPIPALPPQHSFGAPPNTSSFYNPAQQRSIKNEDSYEFQPQYDGPDADSDYLPSPTMSAPRGRGRPGGHPNMSSSSAFGALPPQAAYKNPNPNNIEIRTKFPVARIKRIMQADEEVGKVAQVTPVAVSKALELFMIALVEGAAAKAREKGGKRVTAQHVKQVVEGDEQFDFLGEIVGKVVDVVEGAGGAKRKEKAEMGSESEEEKKPKKGRGRRKKGGDD